MFNDWNIKFVQEPWEEGALPELPDNYWKPETFWLELLVFMGHISSSTKRKGPCVYNTAIAFIHKSDILLVFVYWTNIEEIGQVSSIVSFVSKFKATAHPLESPGWLRHGMCHFSFHSWVLGCTSSRSWCLSGSLVWFCERDKLMLSSFSPIFTSIHEEHPCFLYSVCLVSSQIYFLSINLKFSQ